MIDRKSISGSIRGLLSKFGVAVFRSRGRYNQDGLFSVHSTNWQNNPKFRKAYQRGLLTTRNGQDPQHEWRVHIAIWCAANAAKLPGDFVECGVFVGFMSSAILDYLEWNTLNKQIYLVDSFEGPSSHLYNEEEIAKGMLINVEKLRALGGYSYPMEEVQRNFSEWKNVNFVKGFVPDILNKVPAENVSYLHLDMNCAQPEVEAIEFFWEKMVPGGFILLDDYAYSGYEIQGKEMDKLAAKMGFVIASLPTGQGLIIKNSH